jgi:hypothetical protein
MLLPKKVKTPWTIPKKGAVRRSIKKTSTRRVKAIGSNITRPVMRCFFIKTP